MARQLDPTKRKLTDIQCKSAKPLRDENGSTKPIKLSDGYGLNLEVRSDGTVSYTHLTLPTIFAV